MIALHAEFFIVLLSFSLEVGSQHHQPGDPEAVQGPP